MPAPGSSGQRMGFTLPKTTLVPSDHDRAFIGVPAPGDGLDAVIPVRGRMLRSSSAAAPSHTDYYPQPAGYAIHARCWQLFERKVGWQSLEVVVGGLSKVEGLFLGPVTRGQGPFERSANRYNTVADPMYGTGMLEVLHGSMRRKTLRSGSGCTSSSIRYLSTQCNLPAEILFMILNYLTLDEVADCVTAFGEVLEGKYWQRLVGVDTVFEVQDMDPESLDWVYLVTEMRERNLFGETKGLWTRELILRRIRVIASA